MVSNEKTVCGKLGEEDILLAVCEPLPVSLFVSLFPVIKVDKLETLKRSSPRFQELPDSLLADDVGACAVGAEVSVACASAGTDNV